MEVSWYKYATQFNYDHTHANTANVILPVLVYIHIKLKASKKLFLIDVSPDGAKCHARW